MPDDRRPPQYPTLASTVTPPGAPGAGAATKIAEEKPAHGTNVKETIESILVAFILAFIFRAFVVEAFVIPTGSMATTLLGAHMRFRCPDCGYVFDVNFGAHGDADDMSTPSDALPRDNIYCPNCGYLVADGPRRDLSGKPKPLERNGELVVDANGNRIPDYPDTAHAEPVHYGDRILVLKYAYLFDEPSRWDVVVFKSPSEPKKYAYQQNFIKRLVGKPGETLMILDGEIYLKDEKGSWHVQARPEAVQESLWRVVYDDDYYPQGLPRPDRAKPWAQPWKPASGGGWDLGKNAATGREFRFSSAGEGTIAFDARANPGSHTTNDYLVYDIPENQRRPGMTNAPQGDQERNTVSDLKLSAWYRRAGGDGPLRLRLSKRDHEFVAELTGDTATLFHTAPDGVSTAVAGPVKLAGAGVKPGSAVWVEFQNVDYRVSLRLNGKDVLHTTPEQYAPDVDELLKEANGTSSEQSSQHKPSVVEISATGQACTLSHVCLGRSIYYTNPNRPRPAWGTPGSPVRLHRRGEPREGGGGAYDDDEYFVLGDNSLISGDARYWDDPIDLPYEQLHADAGRVPGRFILGKAFFVYWPAGFRPAGGLPAVVPNFGDMRFIH